MAPRTTPTIADQDISDSYIYLLGRLLVTRQQQLDFQEGFNWNQLVHRKPAEAPDGNWLPTPKGQHYNLTFRFYGPRAGVAQGTYFPPPLTKQ